jgi:UDP-2,3-diacylglucosamine hydrolase
MHSIFVSDLHLAAERPHINELFFGFLRGTAARAQALYILGDLFEYWVGDDDLDPLNTAVADALRGIADRGVALHLMHGNRDVLVGEAFAERSSARLLADPVLLDLHGTRTLLMHGDTLCTDDVEYQKFRAYMHDPANQRRFLAQPLAVRRQQVLGMRAASEEHKREFGDPRLIHGHTHRPARHEHVVDGRACERWVLNDWYERGGYLRCDASGCVAVML